MAFFNFKKKDEQKATETPAPQQPQFYDSATAPPGAQGTQTVTTTVSQQTVPGGSETVSVGSSSTSGMGGAQSAPQVVADADQPWVVHPPDAPVAPAQSGAVSVSKSTSSSTDGTGQTTQQVSVSNAAPAPGTPVDPNAPPAPAAPGAPVPDGAKNADGTTKIPPISNKPPTKQEELDLMTHLTQRSNRVFMLASGKAKEFKVDLVDSEHVLYGLLADSEIYKIFTDLKIQPSIIETELAKVYKKGNATANPQLSPRVKRIIDLSLVVSRQMGFEFISPEHILVSLVEEGEGAGAQVLKKLGLKKEDLNKKVTGKKGKVGEEKTEDHKSALTEFTINLTEKAAKGLLDPVVERSEVVERVIHILSRRTKNNPALTGEAGVGKTAVVEGLATAIVTRKVPESLLNKQILELDLMAVLAGASHRGEFESRLKNIIEEVKNSNGGIILFIDEIHNIVGAGGGGEGSMDASNFLKPALARGELQLIGATTLTEYRKYIEKDPALERRFQPVLVPEPNEEAAIKMLKAIKGKYEAFHRVKITDEAIEAAVKLSKRYVGDRFLPDKAVDLIDEAASAVRLPMISLPEEIGSLELRIKQLEQEKEEVKKAGDNVHARILNSKIQDVQGQLKVKQAEYDMKKAQTTTEVRPEVIKEIVGRWTGIPVSKISESEVEKLAHLEDIIHERMIDQEEAVGVVSQAIRRGRAGLKSTHRPIGSFIFLGPTGVGKTELAKTVAEILFGQEEAMIRLDMTEFMEKHEVAKLLGAPPGYVGYEEGGKLTEAVRRKPYSVVLFDEIEKAHPDIFNIMLQILDDGRLTDNKGHVISFKNTVVICTSNIGSKTIQQEMINNKKADKDANKDFFKAIKEKVMAELLKFFRPELVNRFDEVTVFEPLSFKDVLKVVRLQMKALVKLLEDQDMGMVYTDAALEEIARVGYDPVFGARPLQRTIQKMIENPISTLIIKGEFKAGDVVKVDFNGSDFVFDVGRGQLFDESAIEKEFMCLTTNKTFKTVVKPSATVISPYCGSTNVKPLFDPEIKKEKTDEEKKVDAAADPNAPKDPNAPVDPNAPKDPNAPVDPNAPPVDPNAPKDPNAPVDPNAPAPAGNAMEIPGTPANPQDVSTLSSLPQAPVTPEQSALVPPMVAPVNTVPTQDPTAGIVTPDAAAPTMPPAAPETPAAPTNGNGNAFQFGGGGQLAVN